MSEIALQVKEPSTIVMQVSESSPIAMTVQDRIVVKENDYEQMINKPQINSVELIGNKLLADLFPDGIIVDGGSAEGVI